MEHLETIKERFKKDNFAQRFGIVLDDLTNYTVKMHMQLTPELNNLFDRPHGGAIYALADAAFSVIGNNQNILSVALDCSITYHASPEPTDILFVEGKLITQSNKIGSYLFEIYTLKEQMKNIVATMKSVLYRTGKPIQQQ
jgi:acyl-CoA thioesterase